MGKAMPEIKNGLKCFICGEMAKSYDTPPNGRMKCWECPYCGLVGHIPNFIPESNNFSKKAPAIACERKLRGKDTYLFYQIPSQKRLHQS